MPTRTLWMFPRNKRNAIPIHVCLMLRTLAISINDEGYFNNQDTQNFYIEQLNNFDVTTGQKLIDETPGGGRTFAKYLEQLGLIVITQEKKIFFTLAGMNVALLQQPVENLQRQVLRLQFPSPYSLSGQVRIDQEIKVRPALFIIQLLRYSEINNYLCDAEIAVAVIYGRTHDTICLKNCVNKIIEMRNLSGCSDVESVLAGILDNPKKDLWTMKTGIKEHQEYEEWKIKRCSDIIDIANTLKNRMQSVGLIKIDHKNKPYGKTSYQVNHHSDPLIDSIEREEIIEGIENKIQWQRQLGRGDKQKDTRRYLKIPKFELGSPEELLEENIIKTFREKGNLFNTEKFCIEKSQEYSLRVIDIQKKLREILPKEESDLERQLYSASTDRKQFRNFELMVNYLLKSKFTNLSVTDTAQKKRLNGPGAYADILIQNKKTPECMIIDTKTNKRATYALPIEAYRAMRDYIKVSKELTTDPQSDITYAAFVSSGFAPDAYNKAKVLTKETNCHVALLTIQDLLDIVEQSAGNENDFFKQVLKF
jgi:hypothetical protein